MITTDKRYQVFVSSTYDDLQDERKEVMQALLELDCIPAGMELFPASSEDQWSLIKRVIDDCDYYILIIGGRYAIMIFLHRISRMNRKAFLFIGLLTEFRGTLAAGQWLAPYTCSCCFGHADFADDADFSLWKGFVPQISQI